jgi:hypothetical protein
MRRIATVGSLLLCAALTGCGGDGIVGDRPFRWAGSPNEQIEVNGLTYQVQWARVSDRVIDMRTVRIAVFNLAPDPIIDQQNGKRAATIEANRLCPRSKVSVEFVTIEGQLSMFRATCVPIAAH